jgi:D-3-phosphoglycerate dehydrogenase
MISLKAAFGNGIHLTVDGTLMGIKKSEKIIAVDNFDLDLQPTDYLLFLKYTDRPGVVGIVGESLGKEKINIASMQVARSAAGGEALMVITVDSAIPQELVTKVGSATGATLARTVSLRS